MSWTKRLTHPNEMLTLGEDIEVIVLNVNREKQEISLGLKQTEVNPWAVASQKYPAGTVVTALASPSVNTSASNVVACHETANGSAYAVSAPLTTDGQFWCVDSTGKSSQSGTALIPNATVCP